MNQYGRRAQRYWQQNLPRQYAQIPNPEAFFGELGQTLAQRIDELAEETESSAPSTQDYMGNLGRMNMVRQEAEMEVFREMLPPPESALPQPEDDPASM
jgi:hypothetical protein